MPNRRRRKLSDRYGDARSNHPRRRLRQIHSVAPRAASDLRMETPASEGSTGNNGEVVRLVAVHKTYRTGEMELHAVRRVSLEIRRAEFVALMGASGSGKSTLMNILGCLDRPTSGRYVLDDADVSGLDRD